MIHALPIFTGATLIAGLGLWFGIPVQLERPVLYEEQDSVQAAVDSLADSVEPFLALAISGQVMAITFAYGTALFANIITQVSFAWAALILIKGLARAHEFSWAAATGVLVLSGLALYVLPPLASILIGGYILPV